MTNSRVCHQCGTELGESAAFCPGCGVPLISPPVESNQSTPAPPPLAPGESSSTAEATAAQPTAGDSPEIKSARIISVLAAVGGVGSTLAVLIPLISYFVFLNQTDGGDQQLVLDLVISTVLYLVPSLFLCAHAVGAIQRRDLYPERDRVLIAAIAAATVGLLRFGSLARVVIGDNLDIYRPTAVLWYRWGLIPVDSGMNNAVRVLGIVVLVSIGAAVIAAGWFIVETKLSTAIQRNALTRIQRRGVGLVLIAVLVQGLQRWSSGSAAIADVAGAALLMVFAFVGGLPGERAVTILGVTVALFTVAGVLGYFASALILDQPLEGGLVEFVLQNGFIVLGCALRCPNGERWKEALRAPRHYFGGPVGVRN